MAACLVLLVTSAAKALYQHSLRLSGLAAALLGGFGRIVEYAYQSAAEKAPLTAEFVWKLAPTWELDFLKPGFGVLGVYLLLLWGGYLRSRGFEYKKLLKVIEQHLLLRQLDGGEQGVRRTRDRAELTAAATIPSPPWHQGALGTIAYGVLIGILVEGFKVVLGLAKLP